MAKNVLHCTLAELDERMTPDEFYRWKLFDFIDPIGDKRLDHLATMICSFLVKDSIDLPEWGSFLWKYLPKEPLDYGKMAAEMLRVFDTMIIPSVAKIPPSAPPEPQQQSPTHS